MQFLFFYLRICYTTINQHFSNNILKIEKTRGTVGVDNSSLVISVPEKVYQSISAATTNGDIIFENITSSNYKCSAESGNIKGVLKGRETDYSIVTRARNGKSTLENNVIESAENVEFNVENGDIDIEFSE